MRKIYMHKDIRFQHFDGPAVIVDDGQEIVHYNQLLMFHEGKEIGRIVFVPEGYKATDGREIRAWIEVEDDVTLEEC